MKESNLTFSEGFMGMNAKIAGRQGRPQRAFDWDKASSIIKEKFKEHPTLVAEAGLEGDWNFTGGVIFEKGKPTNDSYTYLSSNWATPTLILTDENGLEEEIECFANEADTRFGANTKWDETSLEILGIKL
jgi:hypothetical protein